MNDKKRLSIDINLYYTITLIIICFALFYGEPDLYDYIKASFAKYAELSVEK